MRVIERKWPHGQIRRVTRVFGSIKRRRTASASTVCLRFDGPQAGSVKGPGEMNGTSQGCARLFLLVIASLLATNAVALMGQPHQVQRLPFVGSRVPVSSYVITHVHPHDPHAFTQGLEYRDGALFEGTGLNGQSTLRKVEIATARVLQQAAIPADYFGEGITTWGETILQLTWKTEIGIVYDRTTLKQLRT